jgi:hypothetical protein
MWTGIGCGSEKRSKPGMMGVIIKQKGLIIKQKDSEDAPFIDEALLLVEGEIVRVPGYTFKKVVVK